MSVISLLTYLIIYIYIYIYIYRLEKCIIVLVVRPNSIPINKMMLSSERIRDIKKEADSTNTSTYRYFTLLSTNTSTYRYFTFLSTNTSSYRYFTFLTANNTRRNQRQLAQLWRWSQRRLHDVQLPSQNVTTYQASWVTLQIIWHAVLSGSERTTVMPYYLKPTTLSITSSACRVI